MLYLLFVIGLASLVGLAAGAFLTSHPRNVSKRLALRVGVVVSFLVALADALGGA